MIHTTIGVYPNGDYKTNGVSSENLAVHIWYNISMRPGRTLYVDGALIYKGIGFTDDLEVLWGKDLDACECNGNNNNISGKASEIKVATDTVPYH
jgi:hypothetical protein